MNRYIANDRRRRQIEREHFMLYHWMFFPECRIWTRDEIVRRLKCKGLLSKTTNACDCSSVSRFWRELKVASMI